MTNANRETGTLFERELCIALSMCGFWAHMMAQNSAGQPFDVIAARNSRTYPIDCKVCENDVFRLVRIEENQLSAMTLWRETGNSDGWFALKMSDGQVYLIPLSRLEEAMRTKRVLNRSDIREAGIPLEEWVMAS